MATDNNQGVDSKHNWGDSTGSSLNESPWHTKYYHTEFMLTWITGSITKRNANSIEKRIICPFAALFLILVS